MPTGTMTSKGQITVPKEVREALGLAAGVRVSFEAEADGSYRLRPLRDSARLVDLAGLIGYGGPVITLEEMDRAIAEGALGL